MSILGSSTVFTMVVFARIISLGFRGAGSRSCTAREGGGTIWLMVVALLRT